MAGSVGRCATRRAPARTTTPTMTPIHLRAGLTDMTAGCYAQHRSRSIGGLQAPGSGSRSSRMGRGGRLDVESGRSLVTLDPGAGMTGHTARRAFLLSVGL